MLAKQKVETINISIRTQTVLIIFDFFSHLTFCLYHSTLRFLSSPLSLALVTTHKIFLLRTKIRRESSHNRQPFVYKVSFSRIFLNSETNLSRSTIVSSVGCFLPQEPVGYFPITPNLFKRRILRR